MHKILFPEEAARSPAGTKEAAGSPILLNSRQSFNKLLAYLGQHFHCERTYIFEFNHKDQLNNTYEWCAPGVTPEIDFLQDVDTKLYAPYWLPRFYKHEPVIIRDLEQYKGIDRPVYDILKPQNIHTLLASPIFADDILLGFIGIDNPPAEQIDIAANLFRIIAPFISVLIYHRDNIERLRTDTMHDFTTGLCNRRAVQEFMSHYDHKRPIGFIYCDLNNLKETNDTYGHKAGDKLITATAQILRQRTPAAARAYRMGGDEFLLLYPGSTQNEFYMEVSKLRKTFHRHQIQIAMGALWCPEMSLPFETILHRIDREMYKDKRACHSRNQHHDILSRISQMTIANLNQKDIIDNRMLNAILGPCCLLVKHNKTVRIIDQSQALQELLAPFLNKEPEKSTLDDQTEAPLKTGMLLSLMVQADKAGEQGIHHLPLHLAGNGHTDDFTADCWLLMKGNGLQVYLLKLQTM